MVCWLESLTRFYYVSEISYIQSNRTIWLDSELIRLIRTDSTYYNIFEHKIYSFYINLWLTSHCPSHFLIQFIAAPFSEERPKLLGSFSSSRSPKLTFSIPINSSVKYWFVVMDNMRLGYQYPENYTNNFGCSSLDHTAINWMMKCDRQWGITYKFI